MTISSALSQWFPRESPPLTEKNLARQAGKVFMVTGGNSGIGFELVRILYHAGATVYLAARSEAKAQAAIAAIEATPPASGAAGTLRYLHLDLDDLSTIKTSAAAFAAQESRLDVLWNNAGIFNTRSGERTKQGIEQHVGVNCVAPLLFTQLLLPQLRFAASKPPPSDSGPYRSRVVWTSSFMTDAMAPKDGLDFDELEAGGSGRVARDYGASRAGNWCLAVEGARRWGADGVLSVAQNPGNLHGRGWDDSNALTMFFANYTLYPAVFGAYTELYSGLSADIGDAQNGGYVVPWGKVVDRNAARADIVKAMEPKEKGGQDLAKVFWEYCEGKFQTFR